MYCKAKAYRWWTLIIRDLVSLLDLLEKAMIYNLWWIEKLPQSSLLAWKVSSDLPHRHSCSHKCSKPALLLTHSVLAIAFKITHVVLFYHSFDFLTTHALNSIFQWELPQVSLFDYISLKTNSKETHDHFSFENTNVFIKSFLCKDSKDFVSIILNAQQISFSVL